MSTTPAVPAGAPRVKERGVAMSALRRPVTLVSVAFILVVFFACLAAPLLAPFTPQQTNPADALAMPGGTYWLGTDALGRDVLSRLLYGGRIGLLGPLEAVVVAAAVGVPLGLIAGYRRGWVDTLLSRTMDVMLAVPGIVVLLTVVSVFGRTTALTMFVLGVLMAPNFMLLVRGETLAVAKELFVDASRASGTPSGRIIRRQILPNVISPVVVQISLTFAIALLISAGLGFLGLSEAPPTPSWGGMVAEAAQNYSRDPWLLVPSGGIITLTAVAFNLAGAGIRDALTERGAATRVRPPRASRRRPEATASSGSVKKDGQDLILSVRDLEVTFFSEHGERQVLSGVSLDVARGHAVALVGESGSGKSVTAQAALGLLPSSGRVTGGSVTFDGADVSAMSAGQMRRLRARRVGFISQDPMLALDPAFTVMSQMTEVVRARTGLGRRVARAKVLELLRAVGLTDPESVAARFPFQLSGGMAQRVSIAMAVSGEPDLLIADEPTTALDVTTQAEILELLRNLQHSMGMALLLVTHDFGVVADVCDSAVVMYAGQVVERAPVGALFDLPLNPYTAILLRSDPHRAAVGERLPALHGQAPAAGEWLPGCRLADRCPLMVQECSEKSIPLIEVAPDRVSRCIRVPELAAQEADRG